MARTVALLAMFPLATLMLLLVVIVTARLDDPGSHRLWPFELFAWAMANMIYMVIVMTAKRKLDKHALENLLSSDFARF